MNPDDETPPLTTFTKRGWGVLGFLLGIVFTIIIMLIITSPVGEDGSPTRPLHVTADCSQLRGTVDAP